MKDFARPFAWVAAFTFLVFGVWAFLGPESFFDKIATYPPYNEHLLHDLGAFQIGLGVTLLSGLLVRDALSVALYGASAGALFHALAHFLDTDLGGKDSDPWVLGALAVALLAAAVSHGRRGH